MPDATQTIVDHTACQARLDAMYEVACECLEKPSALLPPRRYFDHVLGTTGHHYDVKAWTDLLAEVERLNADLDHEAREHQVTHERWMQGQEEIKRLRRIIRAAGLEDGYA